MEKHIKGCPWHEEAEIDHVCSSQDTRYGSIEWDGHWSIYLKPAGYISGIYIAIQFCPFCGDELPIIQCKCNEIKEALKEQEIYFKTDGFLP